MTRHRRATIFLPLIWSVWFFLPACYQNCQAVESANPTSQVPPWRNGVSTFDGNGYRFPARSESAATLATRPGPAIETTDLSSPNPDQSAAKTYTVPTDFQQIIQTVSAYDASDIPLLGPQRSASAYDGVLPPPVDFGPIFDDRLGEDLGAPSDLDSLNVNGDGGKLSDQINAQLDAAIINEPAPLEQEVIRWYQYPRRWTKGWDSHAEFGIDGSDGNADTLAIQTGLETKRKTDQYTFALDLDYRQASSRGVTTEDNGRLNLDYDRMLPKSPWSTFSKLGLEWDEFKAFDLRLNLNGGLGYHWIRSDTTTLVTRFGAGASREFGSPVEVWTPEGVFAIEAERQISERQKIKGRVDYFPSLEDFTDFRLVSDASWEILLDGSENFSLKLSASDRYDSTPQGALANDLYYSLLLLYKF